MFFLEEFRGQKAGFSAVLLILILMSPPSSQAELPSHLDKAHFDWVCVTTADLVPAYQILADYRQQQGLASFVLSLEEAFRWSPSPDDTMATLRWVAGVAVNNWGADYLVLGGSHGLLPAPIHRLALSDLVFDHPTDAYYRCLEGQWDADGDGLFAEWDEDQADPTVHISLGRIPADNPTAVAHLVQKIIDFENRPLSSQGQALYVASLMDPQWVPGDMYPSQMLNLAIVRYQEALEFWPDLRVGTLFQGDQLVPPLEDPLNPQAFSDSLGARHHDFVNIQLNGEASGWELAQGYTITSEAFDPLAGTGKFFLGTMLSGGVADTREASILEHLLTMENGGAVGMMAPTGVGFIVSHHNLQILMQEALLEGQVQRLGPAFDQALNRFQDLGFGDSHSLTTYWYMTLLGDPATLLQPASGPLANTPARLDGFELRAFPNPFNPETTLQFEVPGEKGGTQKTTVEILDLKGRRVALLLDQDMPVGPHSTVWNTGSASGLYFARVVSGQSEHTIKLMLVE